MSRILFLANHRLGRSPSQRFRFEQYIPLLSRSGFDCTVAPLLDENDDRVFYSYGNLAAKGLVAFKSVSRRLRDWARFGEFDIVFVQREALMFGTNFIERQVARRGAKLIFDFDDSIWLPSTSAGNKRWEWLKNPGKITGTLRASAMVFAGNAYLADYARQFNSAVHIVPTTIDTDVYVPPKKGLSSPLVTIGWSGSITTIEHFKLCVPMLGTLRQKFGDRIAFRVIGDHTYSNPALGIQGQRWDAATEVADLSSIDIGIMPLPDDEWSRGKCGLKGLQYMALGIPTIMSPVGVNSEIVTHGKNGFLASSDQDWVNCISALVESPTLRSEFGTAGRATVCDRYSVRSQMGPFLQLIQGAVGGNTITRPTVARAH